MMPPLLCEHVALTRYSGSVTSLQYQERSLELLWIAGGHFLQSPVT